MQRLQWASGILVTRQSSIQQSGDSTNSTGRLPTPMQKLFDAWSAQQAEPTVQDVKPENGAKNAPKKNAKKKNPTLTN